MSEVVTLTPPLQENAAPPASRRASRGLLAMAAYDAIGRTSTRLAIGWLLLIGFCAVFAPFLANSSPLLLKMDGHWSSPLLQHLQWTDVFLLIATPRAAWVMFGLKRLGSFVRLVLLAVLLLAIGSVSYAALDRRSDALMVYEQYREAAAEGHVQWALHTPIPFSPRDYERDRPYDVNDPAPNAPSRRHWMGTEQNGGDIASRMIHACRIALSVGFIAEGVSLLIGVTIGGLMGYFAGAVDLLGMRLIEIFSSIPQLYLLLTFVAFFGRNLYLIMLIIGLTSWTGYAAFIRAQFLSLRNQDFVQAARAIGLPTWRVVFLHMLPNGISPVLVSATFGVASAIMSESALSFLGVGLVDDPSWGQMLNQALGESRFYWWLGMFPGLAIFMTVLAYNVIGESLRDALDPRSFKRE
ncbi:MAG: ABC transporter permease [Tepidisphaeraceae bacterium]